MNRYLTFISEFVKHPTKMGAIAPSSKELALEIVSQGEVSSSQVIVEFGPGTGVFTRQILESSPENASVMAIELNESLVEILKAELPSSSRFRIYNDSAENLAHLREEAGVDKADCIVCGLPWAAFPDELQDKLLDVIYENLNPGGRFVTFAYLQGLLLPAGMKFAKKINKRFNSVNKSRVVWKNVPPAFVYKCLK